MILWRRSGQTFPKMTSRRTSAPGSGIYFDLTTGREGTFPALPPATERPRGPGLRRSPRPDKAARMLRNRCMRRGRCKSRPSSP
jgi:hypothetical protein